MDHYRCMDCQAIIPWYDAFILGRSRCPACHEATLAWQALEAGSGIADEVSDAAACDEQVTVPLEIRRALEEFSRPLLNPPPPPPSLSAASGSPLGGPVAAGKLQPVVLELASGRLECGRCGALAMLVRLWHTETCDDPAQYAFQALCQGCWEQERSA